MKRWLTITLFLMICLLPFQAAAIIFNDLDRHWAEEHVYWATFDVPVFSGYPDGSYRPDQPISRAEFMTMLRKILEQTNQTVLSDRAVNIPYSDMPASHWAYHHIQFVYQYLEEAQQADLTMQQIYPTSLLLPSQPISRYEVALLTHSLTTPSISSNQETALFVDIPPTDPHYRRLVELADNGMISGYEDGTFRPTNQLTRAEAAVMAQKIYRDLSFLTPDRLTIAQPPDAQGYQYPTLDMPARRTDFSALDRRMDNVIATLEYKAIVGVIPFDEQDLYDPDPIETLWDLKNENYPHVIANNYYLLAYDSELQLERKRELSEEALLAYIEQDEKQLDGFMLFVNQVNLYSPAGLMESAVKAFMDTPLSEEERVEAVIFLSTLLQQQGKRDEALALYPPLINSVTDYELKLLLIRNEVVMRLQIYGAQNALSALGQHWENLVDESRYWFYEEIIRDEFTALTKQLLIQN
ncbi:MAG: S-layer homology domain-containing protein [Bacillota bacterium]|nr:S-layer homology domain-containing protein [Bacillota bacterium]MDW7678420.1 S-layer homology domain-containing protein [Bacillota bacterium]